MTPYQLMYLRFLRMKSEYANTLPTLRHDGHEPTYQDTEIQSGSVMEKMRDKQKLRAEREFYRPVER